jgi:HK97 gp10 family phage protein
VEFRLDVSELQVLVGRLEKKAGGISLEARAVSHDYADKMVKEAKRLVPVDTGTLRQSIRVTPDTEAGRARIAAAGIEAEAPYAGFVEFGTARMRPQPYIRPAVRKYTKPYLNELADVGRDLLGTKTAARKAFGRTSLVSTMTVGRMFKATGVRP